MPISIKTRHSTFFKFTLKMNMKHILPLLLLSFIFLACKDKVSKQQDQSTSAKTQMPKAATLKHLADGKLRYLELYGTAYERGKQHGELLKNEIKAVTDSLLNDIANVSQMDARAFISKFLKTTDYVSAMQKWTPDLLDEIKGIADGSGVDYDVIFMHQLGDEFFFNSDFVTYHKCSSIGINKNAEHPTLAAQNMDIPTYFHGYQTVMKIHEADKELLVLTIPGHIGITGMNSKAVSINCNILIQLDHQQKGLPVSGIVRGVLAQNDYEEAIGFVKGVEHASAQNYLIGGLNQVSSLECSSSAIEVFKPFETAPFTYHTNYPLVNKTFSQAYLDQLAKNNYTLEESMTWCQRIPSFEKRFNEQTEDFGIPAIKEVLSSRDHDGLDVLSNIYTYASVVYELSEEARFHIAAGKPHEEAFISLDFK